MSNTTRRGCIATVGVLLSSGCLGSATTDTTDGSGETERRATPTRTPRPDSDGDGVVDGYDDYPTDPARSRLVESASDTRNIEEDHYYYYPFSLDQNGYVEMEYVVREGPDIDVIFLSSQEFEHFEAGENYLQYDSLSQWDDGGGSISGPIHSGSNYVVFHNANAPTNFSNDLARVEFEIEISE
ncbi:hypothetical protein [Salinigranum marinum]|uniref:hypothetical protein n=1 Tax=Salinigranum marinum TaxID=1515595 RepID=UPI002989EF5F|nr:hypothetical protein [Salinigranum marinum]